MLSKRVEAQRVDSTHVGNALSNARITRCARTRLGDVLSKRVYARGYNMLTQRV